MPRNDPNLPLLRAVAEALGELRERVVFVGGAVTGVLMTDPLAEGVRATRDVDAIADAGRVAFRAIEALLMKKGFKRDMESAVVCRWLHPASGTLFDLMPVASDVLGFSNRWYPYAVESARRVDLGDGVVIQVASAVAFVATKLEAFGGRGGGDVLGSHDLEDILAIVDGRETLAEELSLAPKEVREAIAAEIGALLRHPDFLNALPGLISEPERATIVTSRLCDLTQ